MKILPASIVLTIVAALPALTSGQGLRFDAGRAAFDVTINEDLVVPYRVFAIYVLPGERLRFEADAGSAAADIGSLSPAGAFAWDWVAPQDAGRVAAITFETANDEIRLNAFVMHPAGSIRNGRLNDYSIGTYPAPLRGDPVYSAPDGFIELNAETAGIALSPHFTLDQFPSKQSTSLPKYLVLREHLLLKLELFLEHVNAEGIRTDGFTVMSGYRTPVYNRAIGNGQHSRHIYGGAADIYIDVSPADGIMDDLNGDGRLNYHDAQYLYRLADRFFARSENSVLRGGLGVYATTSAHGPFLHIDARGHRARWGLIP